MNRAKIRRYLAPYGWASSITAAVLTVVAVGAVLHPDPSTTMRVLNVYNLIVYTTLTVNFVGAHRAAAAR